MEVSSFGLSKVGKREEMNIPAVGFRLPHVKEIGSSNQDQTVKPLLDKEIRLALPTLRKAHPERRYGLTMWKHL